MANIRYLTGFTGSAGLLVVSRDAAMLATDGRYRTQATEQLDAAVSDDVELCSSDGSPSRATGLVAFIARQPSTEHDGRVGLEAEHIVVGEQRRWAELLAPPSRSRRAAWSRRCAW